MDDNLCHCGSSIVECFEVPKPHYGKLECIGVDHHFHGWIKAPRTAEWARGYMMPFGKHKNRTLAEIGRSQSGLDYLRWAADALDKQNIVEAIKTFLATQ